MKRYIQYIFIALIAGLISVSCIQELELETPVAENEVMTLVPRVQSFTNQYVTKADDGDAEIKRLAVLIFNNGGNLVHMQEFEDFKNAASVNINKSMLNLNTPAEEQKLTEATVVMIANTPLSNFRKSATETLANTTSSLTLTGLNDYTYAVADGQAIITEKPAGGFPMVGNTKADLSLNGGAIAVELSILYAKINFSISVTTGSENQGDGVSFTLNKYEVNNVAKEITLMKPENETATDSYYSGFKQEPKTTTNLSSHPDPLTFTFYMLESRYEHNLTSEQIASIYPWGTSRGYESYQQMYKPELVTIDGSPNNGTDGLATNISLSGTYTDYRGTAWDVDYTVYLGKDNAQNFHVDRNSEYTNNITIKGIRNNDTYGTGQVWLDHRVDVTYNGEEADNHITITRETLLDAHIEVRPLRVKWEDGKYEGAKVYLPKDGSTLVDWIGIERFTTKNCQDGSIYCYDKNNNSTGKRKYFTTGLIAELQTMDGEFGVRTDSNGREYIYLLNGECAWIYFDENTGTGERSTVIQIEFLIDDKDSTLENYQIIQSGLHSIGDYIVESYEEYLHSYDSDDKYNLSTSPVDYTQRGLAWGYQNQRISEYIVISAGMQVAPSAYEERYDFFHASDRNSNITYYPYHTDHGDSSFGTGLKFTNRASANRGITIKDMGTLPLSAYQYCLSKNKFHEDAEGHHSLDIHWYLPDIYELESVLKAANNAEDFDENAYYWSSQPSLEGTSYLGIVNEVLASARARSKADTKDFSRTTQNRIRCFYSRNPITADMSNRVPDGLGGYVSAIMKGKPEDGYFHNLLTGKTKENNNIPIEPYPEYTPAYPNRDNSNENSEFKYVTIQNNGQTYRGFEKDPTNQNIWNEYIIPFSSYSLGIFDDYPTGYYTSLYDYPGLIANNSTQFGREVLESIEFFGYSIAEILNRIPGLSVEDILSVNASKPGSTPMSQTAKIISSFYIDLTGEPLPAAEKLRPLDHASNKRLNISFGNGINTGGYTPDFEYYREWDRTERIDTRYWIAPEYTSDAAADRVSKSGSASKTGSHKTLGILAVASKETAMQNAFNDETNWRGEVTEKGAYTLAKEKATSNLLNELKNWQADGWTWDETEINFDPKTLNWDDYDDYPDALVYETINDTRTNKEVRCTVTLTAYVTVRKGNILYDVAVGTGRWSDPTQGSEQYIEESLTDELRIYSGNSITITCNNPDYELTQVRVRFSGDNRIDNNGDLSLQREYSRFIESTIQLPQSGDENTYIKGMEYNDAERVQQWTGDGKQSITLVLAEYQLNAIINVDWDNLGNVEWGDIFNFEKNPLLEYDYLYKDEIEYPSKYLVVDQIDVKCTKKAASTPDSSANK